MPWKVDQGGIKNPNRFASLAEDTPTDIAEPTAGLGPSGGRVQPSTPQHGNFHAYHPSQSNYRGKESWSMGKDLRKQGNATVQHNKDHAMNVSKSGQERIVVNEPPTGSKTVLAELPPGNMNRTLWNPPSGDRLLQRDSSLPPELHLAVTVTDPSTRLKKKAKTPGTSDFQAVESIRGEEDYDMEADVSQVPCSFEGATQAV